MAGSQPVAGNLPAMIVTGNFKNTSRPSSWAKIEFDIS